MKNKSVRTTCLSTMFLIIVLACAAGAQQSQAPPKPVQGAVPPPSTSVGTPATPGAPASEKIVLKVGATQVTQAQIQLVISALSPRAKQVVAAQGLRAVAEEYVKMLLLFQRALEEHLDASPALSSQLELQRAQTLAEAEYQKMSSEAKASQEEISEYFIEHPSEFETVQVREFLIRKRPQGVEDPKQGLTAEEARTKAEAIRKALLAGTDMGKVAEDFATPNNAVMLIDPKPRSFRRTQLVPAIEKAAFDLKDGEVSEPVDTPQAFMVVKVFGHQHPELKEVAAEIETKLLQQKLDAEIDNLRKKAGVWIDEDYFKAKTEATPPSAAPPSAPAPTPKP